ncbi:MAG TPA: cupin domain-containing protein [Candidatus Binataceae bacterium]|nr:cupin domain-containing protein [Candidatus Binataceae bacterium]
MAEKLKPEPVSMYFDPLDAALIRSNEQDWIQSRDGNQFRVLRISKETGAWSALIKAPAGQVNASHTHLGPADFFVLSGQIDYRGGSAKAGDYIYEPAGAVHDATSHPVETVYLANVFGPVAIHGKDGTIAGVLDWRAIKAMVDNAEKKKAPPR